MTKEIKLGFADYTALVFIPDPASTDGSGKTGLVAANLTVSYSRVETDNDVTVTDVTSSLNNLAALTTAHTDWGLLEVSSTLAPGLYRLDIADAVFAAGAWTAVVYVMITTSAAAASPMEFILVAFDPLDTVRLGLTALPNAVPGAAGGVFIAGSNAATSVTTALTANVTGNITGNLSGSVGSVTGAVGSVAGAVGSVTGNVGGNVVGSVASVTAGVTLAASAIQAIWDALTSALTTVGSIGKLLVDNVNATISSRASQASLDTLDDFVDTEVGAIKTVTDALPNGGALTTIQSDLDNIQTRLPAALVSGRMDSSVGAMAADTLTAAALAADAVTEIQSGLSTLTAAQVWDLTNGIETGLTPRQAMRLIAAATAGKLSGAATVTVTIRNSVADDKNRIIATVDGDGNRSALVYDLT